MAYPNEPPQPPFEDPQSLSVALTREERALLRRQLDPQEGAVPPGYDWPTHGGYLGCLMSQLVSLVFAGFLASTVFAALGKVAKVPGPVFVLIVVGIFLACAMLFGRVGWALGKRFYREYPQNRLSVWGEDDDLSDSDDDYDDDQMAIDGTLEAEQGAAPSILGAQLLDPPSQQGASFGE